MRDRLIRPKFQKQDRDLERKEGETETARKGTVTRSPVLLTPKPIFQYSYAIKVLKLIQEITFQILPPLLL
jgi:hypothetical protein